MDNTSVNAAGQRAGGPGAGSGRSEFSYGSFQRTVTLPEGADEDDVKATYDKGILTVSVKISEPKKTEKKVEIESSK